MKNGFAAVLIVSALLSTSGSTLAAGKMGGASGMDVVGQSRPLHAGKLGGAGGMDEFLLAEPEDTSCKVIALSPNLGVSDGDE